MGDNGEGLRIGISLVPNLKAIKDGLKNLFKEMGDLVPEVLKDELNKVIENASQKYEEFCQKLEEKKREKKQEEASIAPGATSPSANGPSTTDSSTTDSSTTSEGGEGSKTKSSIRRTLMEKMKDPEEREHIAMKAIRTSANMINSGLKKGFGIVEDIYGRMKASSPLLQAIESMFNLAMQLFFMPLGNKLAEVLLPSVLQLVDEVVAIWNAFEGKSLGDMFDFAIQSAVKLFGGFFSDIGDKLVEQGGMIGKVGQAINSIGDFIESSGEAVLTTILGVVTSLVKNFKHFVSLWLTLKMSEIAMQGAGLFGDVGTNAIIAVGAIGMATMFASEVGMEIAGFSKGGYVPATPGGKLARIAEGGEGEYIVPESKLGTFIEAHSHMISEKSLRTIYSEPKRIGGDSIAQSWNQTQENNDSRSDKTINISYHITGYTDSELKTIIRETVDEQVAKSTYWS